MNPWLSCSCHCNRNQEDDVPVAVTITKWGTYGLFVLIIKIMGLSTIGADQSTKALWILIFLTILVDRMRDQDKSERG